MRGSGPVRKVHHPEAVDYCRDGRHAVTCLQLQHNGKSKGVGGTHRLYPIRRGSSQ